MSAKVLEYFETIEGLHAKWEPHPGQIPIGKALLQHKTLDIFVQAGRNFGKTELVSYLLWRWARTFPGSECYYFAPFMKQAREILWASHRLQTFGPMDWINPVNNTEMRIPFKNGSFIKCDGSDNVEAYRGVKPKGLIVFDEFKDFRPEFYDVFDPNRAAYNAPLFIIGTPPDRECQFTKVAHDFKQNPKKAFFEAPTEQNPYISKAWLDNKKKELYSRSEGDVWEREYMAKLVKGGVSKIFPMVTESSVKPHGDIMSGIKKDLKKLEWYLWADPAAATCFAVLFLAVNPYTKHIYILDEIYEKDQNLMTVKRIGKRIMNIRDELNDRTEWRQGYDEAETWFANEMMDNFEEGFEASQKSLNDKDSGLSLIKDIFLANKVTLSDRCQKLYWELDNYYKDKNGKVPKKDDHLIDCFRYALGAAYYQLTTAVEYIEANDENFRGAKISTDYPGLDDMGKSIDDWEER